jgi:hypothetical protein
MLRRSVRFMGVALPGVAAASCAPESALPLSAAGLCKPLPPPEFFDEAGRKLPARLIQVQTVFRHGARLPVEDSGCRDGLCTWTPADSDKRHQLSRFGQIRLYAHGDGDALSPVEVFGGGSGSLVGGGSGGRLTPLGLQQAVELGNELRARYVDASAQTCASISPARLLPATWERARRLVVPRSTRVERTVYTAAGVLHGLYPAVDGHRQIPEIEISLSGEPSDEFLVLNDYKCSSGRDCVSPRPISTSSSAAASRQLSRGPDGWLMIHSGSSVCGGVANPTLVEAAEARRVCCRASPVPFSCSRTHR